MPIEVPDGVTKDRLVEWKLHPVTKAFFDQLHHAREDLKVILSLKAGLDQGADRFSVGYITAITDMLEVDLAEEDPDWVSDSLETQD